MITVKRRLLTEEEAIEKLNSLARRYQVPSDFYEKSAADQMSDFDAQKWVSLCEQLKAARRRRSLGSNSCQIPSDLRSIYGGMKAPFRSEEPENTSDAYIKLAA